MNVRSFQMRGLETGCPCTSAGVCGRCRDKLAGHCRSSSILSPRPIGALNETMTCRVIVCERVPDNKLQIYDRTNQKAASKVKACVKAEINPSRVPLYAVYASRTRDYGSSWRAGLISLSCGAHLSCTCRTFIFRARAGAGG